MVEGRQMKTIIVIILFLLALALLQAIILPFANVLAIIITLAIPYGFWRLYRG
jgi:F0F1-type ATP synthase assembly protein I